VVDGLTSTVTVVPPRLVRVKMFDPTVATVATVPTAAGGVPPKPSGPAMVPPGGVVDAVVPELEA
jgi:hypothetical protein